MGIQRMLPSQEYKMVSIYDTAIDRDKSKVSDYFDTNDIDKLKFIDGKEPTYFIVKNLSSPQQVIIRDRFTKYDTSGIKAGMSHHEASNKVIIKNVNAGEMMIEYFKKCVKAIIDDGKRSEKVKAEDWPAEVISEIGSRIKVLSELGKPKRDT